MTPIADESLRRDEEKLAELGYKQDLERAWSSFSNFAISFTIISVLAGCFTTYGHAWNNGGPIAISWGWPIICALILTVAFSMSELASAYPTAGGPYWWANRLGGPGWSWFTGWFNVIGLIAVVASVDYACATFAVNLLSLWDLNLIVNFSGTPELDEIFLLFGVIMALHALINIYSSHLVALFNNISVGVHVIGVAIIILILIFVPDRHQSADFVFTEAINNSGFSDGSNSNMFFWFYVLPVGFLLTMYTVTGYDASAHVAEETHDAEMAAAKGVWQSVFFSAVIGWFVLLAITFAAVDTEAAAGGSILIFTSAMSSGWAEVVILISTIGQFFCGMACVTSCSRTFYAFSRDRAVPGWQVWSSVNRNRVPVAAVLASCGLAALITLPALTSNEAGIPVAFYAVVSIAVIGLYIAYVAPVYLRLCKGDDFEPGAWNLGSRYRVVNTIAVIWVAICVIIFSLPFTPAAVPWNDEFDWSAVNYAPLMVGGVLIAVGLWWLLSARNTYTGPVRTIEFAGEGMGIAEGEPIEPGDPSPAKAAT
jgi:amino acid transporter